MLREGFHSRSLHSNCYDVGDKDDEEEHSIDQAEVYQYQGEVAGIVE